MCPNPQIASNQWIQAFALVWPTPAHGQGLWPGLSLASLLEPSWEEGAACLAKRSALFLGLKHKPQQRAKSFSKRTFGFNVGEFGLGKAYKEIPFILVSGELSDCSKL